MNFQKDIAILKMGLFVTAVHIYQKDNEEVSKALSKILRKKYRLKGFESITISDNNFEDILNEQVYGENGLFYFIIESSSNWTTILELNVNIEPPVYLSDLATGLSKLLKSYTLLLSLHDGDVLLYNLDYKGNPIDGYNSNYQYFFDDKVDENELLEQRHEPSGFKVLLPLGKDLSDFQQILDKGFWQAFDDNNLDDNGVPIQERYFMDEDNRLSEVGKFLEIFSTDSYPFVDWQTDLKTINSPNLKFIKVTK